MLEHLILGFRYECTANLPINVDCGACGDTRVPSLAYDLTETPMLFHCIPILDSNRSTFVKCGNCGAKLMSTLSCEDLRNCHESDLRHFVSFRDSFIVKCLAIISLLICIFPFLGTAFAAVTWFFARKSPNWVRTAAVIAFVISLFPLCIALVGVALNEFK